MVMVDIEQLNLELKAELEKLSQEKVIESIDHDGAFLTIGDNSSCHQETSENIAFIKNVCELGTDQEALAIIREMRERDINKSGNESI